jgi:hypothetical protein
MVIRFVGGRVRTAKKLDVWAGLTPAKPRAIEYRGGQQMEETPARPSSPDESRVVVPRKGNVLRKVTDDEASRKTFLKMVGGAGAAGAFGILLAACGEQEPPPSGGGGGAPPPDDQAADDVLDVFNYALTLEFLEAKFYRDVIESGVIEDEQLAAIATTFGDQEQEHVDALVASIEQMGGTPAEDPQGDFTKVIEAGPEEVLTTAAMVENLGAGAYLDQAPRLKGSAEALAAALSIHTVEARHAAALNNAADFEFTGDDPLQGSIPDGAFAEPIDMETVMETIQPFLGGGNGGGGNGGGSGGGSGGGGN